MKRWIFVAMVASCASARSIITVPLGQASANYPEKAHLGFVVPSGYQVSRHPAGHHTVDYVISRRESSTSKVVVRFTMRREKWYPTGDFSNGRLLGGDALWRSFRGGPLFRDGSWIQLAELETILEKRTCISGLAGIQLFVVTDDPSSMAELRQIADSMSLRDAAPCR